MITRGCYILTLLVSNVLSLPVPSDQAEKDDIKVMKCIVEVIADTLSKPYPVAISQECQDALTGDERIVSILRHQNLLKELQEIAAQGISERAHQPPQKKSEEVADQVADLGGHPGVEDTADGPMLREGAAERRDTAEEDNEVEEESQEKDGESRESNEIGGASKRGKKESEEEEKENHGNHIADSLSQDDEEEKKASPEEEEEEEEKSSISREDEGKQNEGNETEEDSAQAKEKTSGESEPVTGSPDVESEEKESEEKEEDIEREPEEKRAFEGAEVQKEGEEEEEEDKEPWSNTDEMLPQKSTAGPGSDEEERSVEAGHQSSQILQDTPQHSREDSGEGERRSPEVQELHMMAREEMEDKREEEGSAIRRVEDGEIERLAAIESELESVAQRLHELRRG
ncbi:chromogranin-A-like [Megalops cyprinoides]|uniref:chromogranin-A-like n=1 Tax=Megalops cyprinoides TaxID=118141 RepID=UPI0018646971|nr:chromogranin-A-like [Megalops cyprinoides]